MSDVIGPQSKFQELYLNSNARILIAGGAAGSAKSHIGLMRHLRWTDDPYYRGYCIRKNSTAIMKPGGLFDAAVDLYSKAYNGEIKIKLKDQRVEFPSGASVTFSHYENDKAAQSWQGIEASNIFYDEGSHAEAHQIFWLISRLRTKAKLTPSIWISCNPDPDSYLFDWVKWWLYPEGHEKYGMPDPDKNGAIRYMLRVAGDMHFADTAEELVERFGNKAYAKGDRRQVTPVSFQVLLGTIFDNPWLTKHQPEYLHNLQSLPSVEKRRLLYGDWTARESSSTIWRREWIEEVADFNDADVVSTVRAFDFAGTLISDTNPSPDYSASVRMRKMRDGKYLIDDIRRKRIRVGDWEDFVVECYETDPPGTEVIIPQDPGAAGKKAAQEFCKRLAERGVPTIKETTNKQKLERFRPFASMSQNGGVQVLMNCGQDPDNGIQNDNKFYYKELEVFDGVRSRKETKHDDLADGTSSAFMRLASRSTSISGISKGLMDMTGVLTARNPFVLP